MYPDNMLFMDLIALDAAWPVPNNVPSVERNDTVPERRLARQVKKRWESGKWCRYREVIATALKECRLEWAAPQAHETR